MENRYTDQIKHLMENVYSVADNLDEMGVSESIPFIDSNEGIRGLIQTDVLLFVFRIIDKAKRINNECVDYLNECLGYRFTILTAEMARKRAVDAESPAMCLLLTMFIYLDKQLGGNGLSALYAETISFVTLGYFRCQEHTSLEEMIRYSRYTTCCLDMIERALGEKVDFDPLGIVNSDQKELIKSAVEVDRLIHEKEEDPVIKSGQSLFLCDARPGAYAS